MDDRPLTEQLLPSWHPELNDHLHELMAVDDGGWKWDRLSVVPAHVDIFTDGSCLHGTEGLLALGAWAVVCAQLSLVIASGHLQGICQSIDRGELFAVVVALRWAVELGCGITIWTDSSFVFEGLLLLLNGESQKNPTHSDLWQKVGDLLVMCRGFFVQWVPFHVEPDKCEDPVAEYATMWNQ